MRSEGYGSWVSVCVFVGVIEEKGRERGRKKSDQTQTQQDQRLGDFCQLHYTRQLSGQNYMYF